MPVSRIIVTENFAEIDLGERRARVDYATIPGARWSRARLDALRDALQAAIDLRTARAALPDGDPDKAADPALGERLFWDGGDLVGRAAVVESVAFDGAKPVLTLRRAR